jgi:preprotein translocase subunit YajC
MLASVLLQAAADPQTSLISNLLLFGGIAIVFYFFMIRPQQKKQKDQKTFRESLKKGDMVVTIGGLHGRIVAVEEDTVVLDVDRGMKLTFEKSSISQEASKRFATPVASKKPIQTS